MSEIKQPPTARQLFVFARQTTTELMGKREAFYRSVVETIPQTTRVMDATLASLVAVHQQYRDRFRVNSKEVVGDINLASSL